MALNDSTAETDKKSSQADPTNTNKNNKWKNGRKGPQSKHQNNKNTFKGAISDLNGHVYEVHNEASKANQYQRTTTKEIAAYVNRTMKYGKDIRYLIEHLQEVDFDALKPTMSGSGNKVDEMILQQEVNSYIKRRDLYETNKDALYSIIWGQCSEALQAKLEATTNFPDYDPIRCPIGLLKDIKQVSLKFENVTFKAFAIDDANLALLSFYQTRQDSLHQYYSKFKDLADALEHYGADIGTDMALIRDVAERDGFKDVSLLTTSHHDYDKYRAAAREQYLAVRFLRGADRSKYGDFVIDLENTFARGTNHIPATLAAAYSLLNRIKKPVKQTRNGGGSNNANKDGEKNQASSGDEEVHGMVFVNKEGKPVGKDVVCFECGGNHYKGV